jgi:MFS family permease
LHSPLSSYKPDEERFPRSEHLAGLSINTFLLAFGSFFADVASEMLYPILPLFLTQTLGASAGIVGLIDGVAQALQYVVQGLSGWLSDRSRRYRAIAFTGYLVSAVAKPLIGLSTTWTGVLGARCLDRLGAGSRSAPRDALVAASAAEEHRGKAFGLEGFGDNLGAFLGPLITLALLSWLHFGVRSIFLLALVPGLLAALMTLLLRQRPVRVAAKSKLDLAVSRFPKSYWKYIAVTALFGLGNSSNFFLILRTNHLGASLTTTIVVYALYNLVAALASYPAGYLSDVLGRKRVLLLAYLVFVLVYAGFGLTSNVVFIGALFIFYGFYQGTFRSVGKAMAADLLPASLRASGIGWFNASVGLSALGASIIGGELWTRIDPKATFLWGAFFALAGSIALVVFVSGAGGAAPARR